MVRKLRDWLGDAGSVCAAIGDANDAVALTRVIGQAAGMAAALDDDSKRAAIVADLVQEVRIYGDRAEISVALDQVCEGGGTATIKTSLHLIRSGHEIRLVIDAPKKVVEVPDYREARFVAEAISVRDALFASGGTVAAFAARTGRCRGNVADLVRLSFLAPDIVASCMAGAAPWPVATLEFTEPPLHSWAKQRAKHVSAG